MSAAQQDDFVCSICSQIPIADLFDRSLPSYKLSGHPATEYSTELGTFIEILARSQGCSLCSLLVYSLSLHSRNAELKSDEINADNNIVKLEWVINVAQYMGLRISDSQGRRGFLLPIETLSPMLEYDFLDPRTPFTSQKYLLHVLKPYQKFQLTYGTIKHLFGRELQDGRINLDQIAAWLKDCEFIHDDCPRPSRRDSQLPKRFEPVQLALIDVEKECLIAAKSDVRYFALSYVWGNCKIPTTVTSTRHLLAQEGSLSPAKLDLPRTIRNAMQLVRGLAERYLWVDSLCIVQDGEDKQVQIQQMDQIYSHAFATIIVLSGKSAAEGIPGVCSGSRKSIVQTATVHGVTWANPLPSLAEAIKNSTYNTRGWTYQEVRLSTRCLFIGELQAYWICRSVHRAEDRVGDVFGGGSGVLLSFDSKKTPLSTYFGYYEEAVETYTQRGLSHDSDILNAFAGIASRISSVFFETFAAGLPLRSLCRSLLWIPVTELVRRRQVPDQPSTVFPSWSWIGWKGPITYGATMLWHSGDIFPIKTIMQDVEVCSSTEKFPALIDYVKHPLHEGDCCLDLNRKPSYQNNETVEGDKTQQRPNKGPENSKDTKVAQLLKLKQARKSLDLRFPLFLKFQAPVLPLDRFRLGDVKQTTSHSIRVRAASMPCLSILDSEGIQCGAFLGPEFQLHANTDDTAVQHLLVGMSASCHGLRPSPYRAKNIIGDAYYESESWCGCVLYIMLIARRQDGVSERLAVGHIHPEAWLQAGPKVEYIILG